MENPKNKSHGNDKSLEGSEFENLEGTEELANYEEMDEENAFNPNDEVYEEQFEKYCESGEWFRNNDDDDIQYPDYRNCNYKIG
jgi:hypothetical protein